MGVQPIHSANLAPQVAQAVLATTIALGNRQGVIALCGPVGAGKSTAAAIVARAWPTWGWWRCSTLFQLLMDCRRSDRTVEAIDGKGLTRAFSEAMIRRQFQQASIIVLDDVGARELTEPQTEALCDLLDLRLGLPLIWTTNCTTEQLTNTIGARNRSRLSRGLVHRIDGPDLRRKA